MTTNDWKLYILFYGHFVNICVALRDFEQENAWVISYIYRDKDDENIVTLFILEIREWLLICKQWRGNIFFKHMIQSKTLPSVCYRLLDDKEVSKSQ